MFFSAFASQKPFKAMYLLSIIYMCSDGAVLKLRHGLVAVLFNSSSSGFFALPYHRYSISISALVRRGFSDRLKITPLCPFIKYNLVKQAS